MSPPGLRSGVTLPELILVAWLFGLVLAGLAGFAASQGRLVATTSDRVRMGEVVRVARVVLGGELRWLASSDLTALGGDSARIRAVRGSGPVCGRPTGGGSEIVVRYRGVRRPEPDKDSVLLIHAGSSGGAAFGLAGVSADPGCAAGLRLRLDRPTEVAAGLALVFETGSYSVATGALRYRRGAGGRQPLTEAILAGGGLLAGDSATVRLRLRFRSDSLPRSSAVRDRVLSVHLPNGPVP